MAMFLAPLLMVFTSFNLFALLGCLVIWPISMLVIKFQQSNCYNKGIGIINFGKLFLNFIIYALNWLLNVIPD